MPNNSTRRGVTINSNVQVHEILTLHEYTAIEINAAWYNVDEMDRIARKCSKILRKIDRAGSAKEESKYCIRGLETHTSLGSISKRSNRAAAKLAVFEEQARQSWNKEEESDVQAISDAYRCTTSSCQMWAQVVGRRDQQEAEAYLYDEENKEEQEEREEPVGRKFASSSTIVYSQSLESRIVLRGANTASPIAKVA
ncbi:unnamed protein product [Cylindrotheca closterium]|uniref:Uncharacterized protein n=1 Tax=Cylindrotheca closterium TaxID=2856 RepID=A0AAD2CMM9_9STRA|nr:unnamed protein product [Cylindrotheca closterium]